MKKIQLSLVLLICSIAVVSAQETLTWAMDVMHNNKSVSFSQPLTMEGTDSFTLAINAEQACFAYLVYIDPKNNMDIILNKRFTANETWRQTFELEPPSGRETIHVIMSLKELPDLKKAIDAVNKQNNTRNVRDLNNAIAAARRSASGFNENPEKPVGMGGAVRGDDAPTGTEFSGAGVYVKTIVINH